MSSSAWGAEAVERGIAGTRFAGRVRHFGSVSSTSTLALEAAQSGASEGEVWVADEQTAGRGRGGHTWHSMSTDGLYVSALLRPRVPAAQGLWLSLVTGLAVQAAVREVTGLEADLRWPNDLLLQGKKFGGILVETAIAPPSSGGSGAQIRHAVIGIGINVGHAALPDDLRPIATSLLLESGRLYSREGLLTAVLRALDGEIGTLEAEIAGEPQAGRGLLDRFAACSTWVEGKAVRVGEGDGYTGVTAGLDAGGFLRVRADDGTMHTVLSGGVRPR